MKKKLIIGSVIAALVLFGAFAFSARQKTTLSTVTGVAELYKSPTCGCCGIYGQFLDTKTNIELTVKNVPDVNPLKNTKNIPDSVRSCHTTLMGDYFIEGHVPVEAIEKLMTEKPDIDGIALPGMPSGTPGMAGAKSGTWIIYAVKDGAVSEFMRM